MKYNAALDYFHLNWFSSLKGSTSQLTSTIKKSTKLTTFKTSTLQTMKTTLQVTTVSIPMSSSESSSISSETSILSSYKQGKTKFDLLLMESYLSKKLKIGMV